MLPMIGVPTTAGTGSDAQSYAVIADAKTHVKMACGDPGAAFRVALLDADLTRTQPRDVAAATGYDALSHVVESWVTTARTPLSQTFAREALGAGRAAASSACSREPDDAEARGAMLLGAHFAGLAVEQSMLGAAHACANPLTAQLRHHARHRRVADAAARRPLERARRSAMRMRELLGPGGAARGRWSGGVWPRASERRRAHLRVSRLRCADAGVARVARCPSSARDAAAQWTGGFNPAGHRRVGAARSIGARS